MDVNPPTGTRTYLKNGGQRKPVHPFEVAPVSRDVATLAWLFPSTSMGLSKTDKRVSTRQFSRICKIPTNYISS